MGLDLQIPYRSRRTSAYDTEFFDGVGGSSSPSAEVVVPLVTELIGTPGSVIDVGCGVGAWAHAFSEAGCPDVLGLDGDYVRPDQLRILPSQFRPTDLARPVRIDRRFDLVVCLEVAEHLPGTRAEGLVADLVALGDLVLFSAAIPYQGGVGHVNEQWPSYWRTRFESHGYTALDPLRMRVWDDDRVDPWFKQNLLLYASAGAIDANPKLAAEATRTGGWAPALVHPDTYASKARVATRIMDVVPKPLLDAVRRRLKVST